MCVFSDAFHVCSLFAQTQCCSWLKRTWLLLCLWWSVSFYRLAINTADGFGIPSSKGTIWNFQLRIQVQDTPRMSGTERTLENAEHHGTTFADPSNSASFWFSPKVDSAIKRHIKRTDTQSSLCHWNWMFLFHCESWYPRGKMQPSSKKRKISTCGIVRVKQKKHPCPVLLLFLWQTHLYYWTSQGAPLCSQKKKRSFTWGETTTKNHHLPQSDSFTLMLILCSIWGEITNQQISPWKEHKISPQSEGISPWSQKMLYLNHKCFVEVKLLFDQVKLFLLKVKQNSTSGEIFFNVKYSGIWFEVEWTWSWNGKICFPPESVIWICSN